MKLAELYAEEPSAQTDGLKRGPRLDREQDGNPGKAAVAKAAAMDPAALSRLRPLVEVPELCR
jgi:hypothetical protein